MKFITGNKNKLIEAKKILPEITSENIDAEEIQSLDYKKVIKYKIDEIKKLIQEPFFAEDVSLDISSLNNLPGPLVKWFVKSLTPEEIYNLAPESKAIARASIGYFDGEKTHLFVGEVKGTIVKPKGNSFGFDPIFQPEGHTQTYAQMDKEEKNKLSHRYLALKQLHNFLNQKN